MIGIIINFLIYWPLYIKYGLDYDLAKLYIGELFISTMMTCLLYAFIIGLTVEAIKEADLKKRRLRMRARRAKINSFRDETLEELELILIGRGLCDEA